MMIPTRVGVPMDAKMLNNYLNTVIDMFFKILPLKEEGEPTLPLYIQNFQLELASCREFITAIQEDGDLIILLSILEYFINHPDCNVDIVRHEVFRAIKILKGMKSRYQAEDEAVTL